MASSPMATAEFYKFAGMLSAAIMASGPITSWQIDGETVEVVSDFILGGLQNHCRW